MPTFIKATVDETGIVVLVNTQLIRIAQVRYDADEKPSSVGFAINEVSMTAALSDHVCMALDLDQ